MVNKERIEELLNSLQEWTPEIHVSEAEYCLNSLLEEGLPERDYPRLKKILIENEYFQNPNFQAYIKNDALIKDGAWWLDASKWKD